MVAQWDTADRIVTKAVYDYLGRPIHQSSMDSGHRWAITDCTGQPFISWDNAKKRRRQSCDMLRRPTTVSLQDKPSGQEMVIIRNVYGEDIAEDRQLNLRGQLYQCFDQSGLQTNECFDVDGNCTVSSVRFAVEYKKRLDWSAQKTPSLHTQRNILTKRFNAFGKVVRTISSDGKTADHVYDRCGRLVRVASEGSNLIDNVHYEADGQVQSVVYGNGARVENTYDQMSRHLSSTRTVRQRDGVVLQSIQQRHDCMGRVAAREDKAQKVVYFSNRRVDSTQNFAYDALGQLIEASGREQVDASSQGQQVLLPPDRRTRSPAGDGSQVVEYLERYKYDVAGNILQVEHVPRKSLEFTGWKRTYQYAESSCLDPRVNSNRLTSTSVGKETCKYGYQGTSGRSGCITSMSGYSVLKWDDDDRLQAFSTQRVRKGDTPETTWYVYNARGERVCKVTERASGWLRCNTVKSKETLYLPLRDVAMVYKGRGAIDHQIVTAKIHADKVSTTPVALIERDSRRSEPLTRYQVDQNLELDAAANVVSYEEFSPFGSSTLCLTKTTAPRKYRFASYERDVESGMYQCGERYYVPWLGRWTSADPLGTVDGLNVYAYAGNDPINFDDKQGTTMMYRGTSLRLANDFTERGIRHSITTSRPHPDGVAGHREFRQGDLNIKGEEAAYFTSDRHRAWTHAQGALHNPEDPHNADARTPALIKIDVPNHWVQDDANWVKSYYDLGTEEGIERGSVSVSIDCLLNLPYIQSCFH